MPGLHLICDWSGNARGRRASIDLALGSLLHDERYRATTLVDDPTSYLAHTGYPAYPVQAYQLGEVSAYLEGRLYGVASQTLASRLRQLADLAFGQHPERDDRLREWLRASDGDYLVVLVHQPSGAVRIVNDSLGRLPLYLHQTGSGVIVSRELRLVARLMERVEFDRVAIANTLLCGYQLGSRTWLQSVQRVPPATLLAIDPASRSVQQTRLRELNLEPKPHAARSLEENAAQLATLFLAACAARYQADGDNVLSLSGGFDSRAVGAGLWKLGLPFRCLTYADQAGNAERDIPIARQVAQLAGAPWSLTPLGSPTRRDALKLLRMKNGLNTLSMSYLLPFLAEIRAGSGGEVRFFSGEMGNFTLPDLRPARTFATESELAQHLLHQYQTFPLAQVSALTGLDGAELSSDLEGLLVAYPEQELGQKYVHFLVEERALTWHSEAEDRNRCFFWGVAPFAAIEFFEYALGCPDRQKATYDLYRELLQALVPAVAEIEHAGLGVAMTSPRFRSVAKAAALVSANPGWRARFAPGSGFRHGYAEQSLVVQGLRQQIERCQVLAEYLHPSAVTTLLDRPETCTVEQLDTLFTVASIVEDLATGSSVLER